jgi:hypothetical protein
MVLSYRSSYGEEMGRVQVWPRAVATVYHLGAGMKVRDLFGRLVLLPGTLNRRWIAAGQPSVVRVVADLPADEGVDALTPCGFTGPNGQDLFFTTAGDAARIAYPR